MARISKLGPGTEGGRLILQDFLNWRKTGFRPWRKKGLGGVDHYRSRKIYQQVTNNAFRKQAEKIAAIALEQMPAEDIENEEDDDNADDKNDCESSDEEASRDYPNDSENKNPWEQDMFDDEDEGSDDSFHDGDYEEEQSNVKEGSEDDDELEAFFEKIGFGELENSRSPMLIKYPNKKRLGVVFVCDGDVKDVRSNLWEFSEKKTEMTRYSRVPKEWMNAAELIGTNDDDEMEFEDFGFSDADLMVLDAVLKKRVNGQKRDKHGYIWEKKEVVKLPFPCAPMLYNKKGKRIKNYMMRRNKFGFTWGYFWLVALKDKPRAESKRISGAKVRVMDESSVYTEQSM